MSPPSSRVLGKQMKPSAHWLVSSETTERGDYRGVARRPLKAKESREYPACSPDIELVQPRGVVARDLSALVVRHTIQDALEDLPRLREGGLGVRVVRAPHERVDADELAIANAEAVFLKRQEHVAVEEIARAGVALEAVPRLAARALRIGVVEPVDEMRRPGQLVLGRADPQPRIALEDAREDDVAERPPHPVIGVRER